MPDIEVLETLLTTAGFVPVPDSLRAAAYEAVPAPQRAWLKTTLALNRAVYGEMGGICEVRRTDTRLGFTSVHRTRPASWALMVIAGPVEDRGKTNVANTDPDQSPTVCPETLPVADLHSGPLAGPDLGAYGDSDAHGAARLAAALMCARLAGVEEIVAVWPQATPDACPAPFLTALELAGVDAVYAIPETSATLPYPAQDGPTALSGLPDLRIAQNPLNALKTLIPRLAATSPGRSRGRILCCATAPGALASLLPELERTARSAHVPLWADSDLTGCIGTPTTPLSLPDATSGLYLGAGCAGCWLHTDLSPAFFMDHCFAVDSTDTGNTDTPDSTGTTP